MADGLIHCCLQVEALIPIKLYDNQCSKPLLTLISLLVASSFTGLIASTANMKIKPSGTSSLIGFFVLAKGACY